MTKSLRNQKAQPQAKPTSQLQKHTVDVNAAQIGAMVQMRRSSFTDQGVKLTTNPDPWWPATDENKIAIGTL